MAVTPIQFRQRFPEFLDAERFPDLNVGLWLGLAAMPGIGINPQRWGTAETALPDGSTISVADYATMLYAAHHLTLSRRDQDTADAGGIPGDVRGPISSKSVEGASASYDVNAVTVEKGKDWNFTRYGIELKRMIDLFGAGGLQVGVGSPVGSVGPAFPVGVIWQVF